MTGVEYWAGTPLAAAIGRTLLHSLWEGAAVALLLAIVLGTVRRPLVRYAAACAAMVAMAAGIGVTLAVLWPEPATRYAFPRAMLTGVTARGGFPSPMSAKPAGLLGWLAPCWAAGVVVFYLRGAAGWIAARRLRRAGVCSAAAFWQERIGQLAARMRVKKTVALLESALAEAPVVIGHLWPVVLLPIGLLAGLPAAQVEAILLHELAHVRRRDYLVNLMQAAVEGILFYHPAVWWISGVMRNEREHCCDDLVVAATGSAREYASALMAIEGMRATGAAVAATGGSLMKRMERLLGRRARRDGVVMPAVAAVLTLAVAAGMVVNARPASARKAQASGTAVVEKKAERAATVKAPKTEMPRELLAQNTAPAQQPATLPDLPQRYKAWLENDVVYISTDAEKKAFRELTTDEERDYFVKQFWDRRDPTPGTEENEMKEEHYRRIAYANEHFAANVAGWQTDRGRIYIQYGPPDEIESHPSGGKYVRPASQGGGETQTYPFEQWRYRWIEGVGRDVIIEFVDPCLCGEYHMTMDPSEKDALFKEPGAKEDERLERYFKNQKPR
ncbi:MAG TPA: GWxTD domain-containing protein [Bryobacteraceae bacterium]|nr:GWxTD domain-containing protein [Bryobacteraceae bacterium]